MLSVHVVNRRASHGPGCMPGFQPDCTGKVATIAAAPRRREARKLPAGVTRQSAWRRACRSHGLNLEDAALVGQEGHRRQAGQAKGQRLIVAVDL